MTTTARLGRWSITLSALLALCTLSLTGCGGISDGDVRRDGSASDAGSPPDDGAGNVENKEDQHGSDPMGTQPPGGPGEGTAQGPSGGDLLDPLAHVNTPPVANAGPDQSVDEGELVSLDGSESFDPDQDPLSFAWIQTEGPLIQLQDSHSETPGFTAPEVDTDAVLRFRLEVSDGIDSDEDVVEVTVVNLVDRLSAGPTADAGPDQEVNAGDLVVLDGSGSAGSGLEELQYQWSQIGIPRIELSDPAQAVTSFFAPSSVQKDVTLTFALTVTENGLEDVDKCQVLVIAPTPGGGGGGGGGGSPPGGGGGGNKPANNPPVAFDDNAATPEGVLVDLTLRASDPDGDELTFIIKSPPAHGQLGDVVSGGPDSATVTYTPDPEYRGLDSFAFAVSDGELESDNAKFDISVDAGPIVSDQTGATMENSQVVLELQGSSPQGHDLTFVIDEPPTAGVLTDLNNTPINSATVRYTPDPDTSGDDVFQFKATDALGGESRVAEFTVHVYPVVQFDVDPREGRCPLDVVGGTSTVNGAPLPEGTYTWKFDDFVDAGPMNTHKQRAYVFSSAGVHTVTLTLTLAGLTSPVACLNPQGEEVTPVIVWPPAKNIPPVADLSVDPTSGIVPLEVEFDASGSHDPDGNITDYEWDFDGDGQFNEANNGEDLARGVADPTHTYSDAGVFEPTVRVTDNGGATDEDEVLITVNPDGPGISGTVRRYNGDPYSGVPLNFTGEGPWQGHDFTTETGPNGLYTQSVPSGWTGTVTSNDNYRLDPPSRTYADPVVNPIPSEDYAAFRNHYVDDDGHQQPGHDPEQPRGTINNPHDTIQAAVDSTFPGDTVFVRDGTYTVLNVSFPRSGQPGRPITVTGFPGDPRPIVQRGSASQWVFRILTPGYNNFIFKDLILQLAESGILIAPATLPRVSDIRVENVEFREFDKAGIVCQLYGVERMYIKDVDAHDCHGSEGAFDFKVNCNDFGCGAGSRQVIIRDCVLNHQDNPQSSGVIVQNSSDSFILINNLSHDNGELAFTLRGEGYNILINNIGYDQRKAAYYLRDPWKIGTCGCPGDPCTIEGCTKGYYVMLNNIGISRVLEESDQGALKKWTDVNIWAYNNTMISLDDPEGVPGVNATYTCQAPADRDGNGVPDLGVDVFYMKNNIAFKANDGLVLNLEDGPFTEVEFFATGCLWGSEGNDSSFEGFRETPVGSVRHTLAQFEALTGSPNNNIWVDPPGETELFEDFDFSIDDALQNLHLADGSRALNTGLPYSDVDPNDYPSKIEEALVGYNEFADFTILSGPERQELLNFIRTAHLRDRDGVLRSVDNPSIGAYED